MIGDQEVTDIEEAQVREGLREVVVETFSDDFIEAVNWFEGCMALSGDVLFDHASVIGGLFDALIEADDENESDVPEPKDANRHAKPFENGSPLRPGPARTFQAIRQTRKSTLADISRSRHDLHKPPEAPGMPLASTCRTARTSRGATFMMDH